MSDLDLDALRERLDAATPGPWDSLRPIDSDQNRWPISAGCVSFAWVCHGVGRWNEQSKADAAFIAAARDAIPALLDEVERLRQTTVTTEYHDEVVQSAMNERSKEVGELRAEVERLRSAVAAVEALHRPIKIEDEDEPWCWHCGDLNEGDDWEAVKYPCATVRAIREAMGDE